jgi:hypothetical protein
MTRVLHGIVHGKIIEVTEDLGMSDGQAVELIVTASPAPGPCDEEIGPRKSPKKLPGPPPGWQPGSKRTAAGMLADSWTEEDDRILEEIYRDRKRETRREVPTDFQNIPGLRLEDWLTP